MKTKLLQLFIALWFSSSYLSAADATTATWEYKIWVQPDGTHAVSRKGGIEKELNRLGLKGWELTSVVWKKHSDNTSPTGRMIYYFKRQVIYKILTVEEVLRKSSSINSYKLHKKAEQDAALKK